MNRRPAPAFEPPESVVMSADGNLKREGMGSPIIDILTYLPRLSTTDTGQIDFRNSDVMVLALLAQNADAACQTILRGLSAVGGLLSHAGPELEDGAVSAESVEALGGLVAELGEFAAMLLALSSNCRHGVMTSIQR